MNRKQSFLMYDRFYARICIEREDYPMEEKH